MRLVLGKYLQSVKENNFFSFVKKIVNIFQSLTPQGACCYLCAIEL